MSQYDLEISELQKKIILLEEKKQNERELELKQINNPLNILQNIIDQKRKQIEQNSYSQTNGRLSDKKKLAVLEPIVMMFKKIEDRLEKLEKKN
jgi:hypothetical protein